MISFIVPAHNEQALLGRTLESLRAAALATDRAHEIVVVDDASTDRTAQIAVDHGARVVPVELRKISAVRNAGARAALGNVLIFVDADTVLPEKTLRAALATLDAGAVGGGAGIDFDGPTPLWARAMLKFIAGSMRMKRWAAGCFVFIRRETFDAVGGFDEEVFITEELIFSQAAKQQGHFVILRERVITSARKVHHYRLSEILKLSGHVLLGRGRAVRRREGLELWYDRRNAPVDAADNTSSTTSTKV